jgi:riboflavin synthase
MFNGIVEATGIIKNIQLIQGAADFTISMPDYFNDLDIGASIAVNGVCLTVTRFSTEDFQVTAVAETLRVTNLSTLKIHDVVNLERALKADSRVSGHYVQGHIDVVGEILDIKMDGNALLVKIQIAAEVAKYLVKKGYVGLDGMSITVIDVGNHWFTVTFIPQTQATTIIQYYRIGTKINIEVDILGKYVEKILGAHTQCSPI